MVVARLVHPLEVNKPTPILNQILQQLRSNHALRYKTNKNEKQLPLIFVRNACHLVLEKIILNGMC